MTNIIKRSLRTVAAPLVVGALLATTAGVAVAGNSAENFSTTVGKLNGSGYTGNQVKATTGAASALTTTFVGGGYNVDARVQYSDGTSSGAWARQLASGTGAWLFNSHLNSRKVRVQLSNNLSTRVDVQVRGNWASK